jgi:hypothetical protein
MRYKCPNNSNDYDEWICLCPMKDKSAIETILTMNNTWIDNLIKISRKKCIDYNFTEFDALKEIAFLEEEASGILSMWKTSL